MRRRKNVSKALKYIVLSIIALISLFPFYWMIVSSTNSGIQVTAGKMTFGSELINNLTNLFNNNLDFVGALKNSAVIAICTTILALIIASAAGYGFEIFRTKKRDGLFNILLLSMMIPFCALMLPLYKMFASFSGSGILSLISLDTLPAVIIPTISTAFLVFFFRQNTKSFPKDIIEAARIDGLSEPRIFVEMYFPVMRSTYAAGAIITFMNSWNNYLWPLVALQSDDKRTIPMILSAMGDSYTPDYGMIMAAIVIATLPTAIIFFLMQKQFVAGMIGSVK